MGDSTSPDRDVTACVACGASGLEKAFSATVLGAHEADYLRCPRCGSLQIGRVWWLSAAYERGDRDLDTGLAQRGLMCSLFVRAMRQCRLLRRGARILDFGAGSGLLVRLLRDQGFDAEGYDLYADMQLARDYRVSELDCGPPADLIVATEILEHLTVPGDTSRELAAALAEGGIILITTVLHDPRASRPDRRCLDVEHGQHINFFTRQGLRAMAGSIGMNAVFLPFGFHLFRRTDRPIGGLRRAMLVACSAWSFALARTLGLLTFRHCVRDHDAAVTKRREER